jgi:hypothetical protein
MNTFLLCTVAAACTAPDYRSLDPDRDGPRHSVYLAWYRQVQAVTAEIQKTPVAKRQDVLDRLEQLANRAEAELAESDYELYARVAFDIAAVVHSHDFGANKGSGLSQEVALRALRSPEKVPFWLECRLLWYVGWAFDREGRPIPKADMPGVRRQWTAMRLHAWRRLVDTVDPAWDPERVPSGGHVPSGLTAEGRKAFLAEQRRIADQYMDQAIAHQVLRHWLPRIQEFIIRDYIGAREDKAELERLLREYGIDEVSQEMILKAVENRKVPDSLYLPIPSTRPVARHEPACVDGAARMGRVT